MTTELLMRELNLNDEFNEITPEDLSKLTGKDIYIPTHIICDNVNTYWDEKESEVQEVSADNSDKLYVVKGNTITIDLTTFNIYNGYLAVDEVRVYFSKNDYKSLSYDFNDGLLTITFNWGPLVSNVSPKSTQASTKYCILGIAYYYNELAQEIIYE